MYQINLKTKNQKIAFSKKRLVEILSEYRKEYSNYNETVVIDLEGNELKINWDEFPVYE